MLLLLLLLLLLEVDVVGPPCCSIFSCNLLICACEGVKILGGKTLCAVVTEETVD